MTRIGLATLGITLLAGCIDAVADELGPALRAFVDEMAAEHEFDRAELTALLGRVDPRPEILEAISRPAEAKPWHAYRPIFVNATRIEEGTRFWTQHADALARAEAEYGVPAEIIVAIIGVETRYGQNTGRHRVLDALATLAFHYPPRSDFFRAELKQFLLLTREEGVDPLTLQGSYAGAMGWPQFMPSSFRAYAVDFDGDGHRDLWSSPVDAIGSVAAYLATHRWRRGGAVAEPATVSGEQYKALLRKDMQPQFSARELHTRGVAWASAPELDSAAALLELDGEAAKEYWLAFDNFYVITRYNRSPLYAMAVYQLSHGIREQRATAPPGRL
jgi:membrane-bound lytic murein transglycosylase B